MSYEHILLPVSDPAAGRRGPKPYVKLLASFDEEANYIAITFKRLFDNGMLWFDMCVIYPFKWMGVTLRDYREKGLIGCFITLEF